MANWTQTDSANLYHIEDWGSDYFRIGKHGTVEVTPDGKNGASIDLFELVGQIQARGVQAPMLLRFDGILRSRVRRLHAVFNRARKEYDYTSPYRAVYPIKVNQDRLVAECLLQEGREYGMGLEVGSKPELVAGIALQAGEGSLMICNGYKDQEYVEMAMLSSRIGTTAILVIEKFTELATIIQAYKDLGIRPVLGVRSKLTFKSSGRWQDSVGDRSKFGLTAAEIVRVVQTLKEHGLLDCLQLLHYHVGSQITHIRSFKQAMSESTNVLIGLNQMGANIKFFDVGGGLGIDYDGSGSDADSSRNYSLREYADDVVWALVDACSKHNIPQPTILSESGRALTAHHSVLIGEVVGVTTLAGTEDWGLELGSEEPEDLVTFMQELSEGIDPENYVARYHDAQDAREKGLTLFQAGHFSLQGRAMLEKHYWTTMEAVREISRKEEYVPDELNALEAAMADTYFVNFSVFQSMPDSWAIDQLFPIMPIHRLEEEPTRRAVIADLTCDSDGKVTKFIDERGVKEILELHPMRKGDPYYVGFFLVGAYQEILGDMHNLFGDTNVVHVDLDSRGRPRLSHVVRGDRVKEVLSYLEYFEEDLLRNLRRHVELALEQERMSYEDSAQFWARYEQGLVGYTYLTRAGANSRS
ncbi:MAG: biosynthetic arginine decarboxylase [Planctomycetota bacterium]